MSSKKNQFKKIISKFGKNKKDTGSSKVQIAILTKKIKYLKNHCFTHKKDFHSRRGLIQTIHKRKKLLKFYKKQNIKNYIKFIKKINI